MNSPLDQTAKSDTQNYVVLARKWRSSQFSDIVGQTHIVRTLINAIRSQRLHQAYLFTGSRGIGKTSIARIFAKAIRCESVVDKDGTLISCDQCSNCKEITRGSSVDVIEIDGASNNGVDAVREIREGAKYQPASGKRKIYIIDEVHMLTTAAFNALLKTLEEPPPHILFVFATTEPHKIPATILSRCQRFDFRRHTIAQIQGRLTEITQAENLPAEPAALALIARAAQGSMRDGLSILDQVISYAGQKITAKSVRESIGLIESESLLVALKAILNKDSKTALEVVAQTFDRGYELRVFSESFLELLHDLILIKVGSGSQVLRPQEELAELESMKSLRQLEELELIFQVFHHGFGAIAYSSQPKILLDILMIKCAEADVLVEVSSAQKQAPQRSGLKTASSDIRTGAPAKPSSIKTESSQPQQPTPPQQPAPQPVSKSAEAMASFTKSQSGASTSAAPSRLSFGSGASARPETGSSAQKVAHQGPKVLNWEGFISYIKRARPLIGSLLEHGICEEFPDAQKTADFVFKIGFQADDAYKRDQLLTRVYQEQLRSLIKDFFEKDIPFQITDASTSPTHQKTESLASKKQREFDEREKQLKNTIVNHPVLKEAKALFGTQFQSIELKGEFSGSVDQL